MMPGDYGKRCEQSFAAALPDNSQSFSTCRQYNFLRCCPLDRGTLGVLLVFLSFLIFKEIFLVGRGVGGGSGGVRWRILIGSQCSSSTGGERQRHVMSAGLDPHRDMLVLLNTDQEHFPLINASRAWRQGITAVVGVNFHPTIAQTAEATRWNETLFYYPDDDVLRGWYAMALNKEYKWLLYGDDDTMFFPDNLEKMLRPFDWQLPYIIIDNLWFNNGSEGVMNEHPDLGAPRCVPCHWTPPRSANQPHPPPSNHTHGQEEEPWRRELWRFPPVTGCPCTPQLLSEMETRRRHHGDWLLQQLALASSAQPPLPGIFYSIHGGAGTVISRGLMDRLNAKEFEECVTTRTASEAFVLADLHRDTVRIGSDALLTHCLWLAGFAPTDPGGSFSNPSRQLFDPPQYVVELDLLAAVDSEGSCAVDCQERLTSMVSCHVSSRGAGITQAKDAMEKISTLHRLVQQIPDEQLH